MRTIEEYGTFEDTLANASEQARELASQLRKMIVKKKTEHFCYISAQKNDVNLGFYYGAELPDPEQLLRGTGKLLRHVKIRDDKAIRNVALKHLLKVASTHRMPIQPSE